ncbi:MAG: adenylate/guanylate cyclase domain-containing protein [Solirubrobacterales bacterium]
MAAAIDGAGVSAEILDAGLKIVFVSSEAARAFGIAPGEAGRFYGKSLVTRQLEDRDVAGITEASAAGWWQQAVPIMRHYLAPGDPRFDECFGPLADAASRVSPIEPPLAWHSRYEFLPDIALHKTVLGQVRFLEMQIRSKSGEFLGILRFARSSVPESLLSRLGRGDLGHFERMDRVREPGRRQAAIMFADLEASSVLSRRLSSRGYFTLVSGLTDLVDSAVVARSGIVGKHAGDGGSALFLVDEFDGSESGAVKATIDAARAIRAGAPALGSDGVDVTVNIGLHWGSTLVVGQVATSGRLEVTALGDQMNECARIETAATGGSILASKEVIERLDAADAAEAGVEPGSVSYQPLGELEGAGTKAIRDAGAIPVAHI